MCTPRDEPADSRADALVELAAATGGLAHEIRNPLSTLKVNLQLLAEDWRELAHQDDAAADLVRRSLKRLDTVTREVDRLTRTLEAFLRYARHQDLQSEPIDLHALAADTAAFCDAQARAQGVSLRVEPVSADAAVVGDSDLLRQALLNLVLNAIQAAPPDGDVTLRVRRANAGEAAIDVIDTGPGVRVEPPERVFEPFYTTRKEGTGLGLPTARRIAARHGGRIEVKSDPACGATFSLVLPSSPHAP